MNNPYTPHQPVHTAQTFFGRAGELADLAAFLRHNQSASIVGSPGLGKTSLLLYLAQPDNWPNLGLEVNQLFAYFNCRVFAAVSRDEIFSQFIQGITAALIERNLPPEPTFDSPAASAHPARLRFEMGVHKLNRRGLRIVLSLDDFEYLSSNPALDLNFFSALRAALSRFQLVLLTTSTQPLIELTYAGALPEISSSPFFNIFAQLELAPLVEVDARRLIHEPALGAGQVFPPATEEVLYTLAGGQPFNLQAACRYAFDQLANSNVIDPTELERYVQQTLIERVTR